MAQREKQRNSSTVVAQPSCPVITASKAGPGICFARKIYSTKFVVPAQAGTQTPPRFGSIPKASFFYDNQRQGFWVPAGACHRAALCADPLAGTTLRLFDPAP
ncbi:MAG: hypothetical protein J0I08_01230 [Rhizobiales bacterium]|nr:hypothetical protein [Hyphomicrobiales bacterium]